MGKKGSWLSSIKKALSPNSKEKKTQKSKKKGLEDDQKPSAPIVEPPTVSRNPRPPPELKPIELVAAATAPPSRLTNLTRYSEKSIDEIASIRIQTAFRGYLARRAFRALRGLVRLKTLVDGPTANRQTANTLKSMQNLSRVQCQISSRRIRMSEENQTLQRQLLQKQAKELESLQMGEDWNDSLQSKEQIEAKLLSKYEATMRRERALAYSFSHQQPWKKSSRTTNLLFMDPTNPQWGWSWLERYMAGRLWDPQGEKDNSIHITIPSTPKSKGGLLASRKLKRGPGPSPRAFGSGLDEDSRSVQSEMNRRHSIARSSVRDDESLDSSLSVPSYMVQTKSAKAKAKTRGQSLLGPEKELGPKTRGHAGRPRRHSGPPRVQNDIAMVI